MGASTLKLEFFEAPVLALETSCDETSAAVVQGRRVLANIVSSQADLHAKWGGVVPEAAARAHVEAIIPVLQEALATAGIKEFGAVACTNRPGLVGALSVGVSAAKALALETNVPLLGIHHLEGHLLSPLAQIRDAPPPDLPFPHVCLIVSGGHTELVWVEEPGRYRVLGETLDDAA
ncbi:MAG: tRNA (adenosine(37)-N6)-threonylcarbamoyltransferase complex transferase subunit TsaD, partial [Fimbriimonadaceae bacterium]